MLRKEPATTSPIQDAAAVSSVAGAPMAAAPLMEHTLARGEAAIETRYREVISAR